MTLVPALLLTFDESLSSSEPESPGLLTEEAGPADPHFLPSLHHNAQVPVMLQRTEKKMPRKLPQGKTLRDQEWLVALVVREKPLLPSCFSVTSRLTTMSMLFHDVENRDKGFSFSIML